MKIPFTDIFVVLLSAGSITTFSTMLYQDLRGSGGPGSQQVIGKVGFKSNVAQRRFKNEVVWRDIQQESPIYKLDYVRTDDDSEAVIRLNNGTVLELGASSMVLLDISEKSVDIDFAYGSLSAKGDNKLKIKSADKTVSTDQGDLKLSKSGDENLNLSVKGGNATVNVDGTERQVGNNELLNIDNNQIQIKQIAVRPLSPPDRNRSIRRQRFGNVNFSWEVNAKLQSRRNRTALLEISDNAQFKAIRMRRITNRNQIGLRLNSGIYYWRVSILNRQQKREYSEIFSFSLLYDAPISLLSPAPKGIIRYLDKLPLVNFSWSESSYSNNYTLQISKDPAFQKELRNVASYVSTIAVSNLSEGQYFWRVATNPNIPNEKVKYSPVSQFQIQKLKELSPPGLVNPGDKREINRLLFSKGGVTFNWLKNIEITESLFQISRDSQFNEIIFEQKLPYNFINLKQSLAQGTYYWRVRGSTQQKRTSPFSIARSFRVVNQEKLLTLKPANQESFDYFAAKDHGISFIWKRPESLGQFVFAISRSATMDNPLQEKKVISYNTNISNLEAGNYYWQVKMVDADNQTILRSDVLPFSISPPLDSPRAVFPGNNAVVDMSSRDSLTLDWEGPAQANQYLIELYQTSGNRRKILSKRQKESVLFFRNLKELDEGNFRWSIQALQVKAGKTLRSSRKATFPFRITLKDKPQAPKITSPKLQFIVE